MGARRAPAHRAHPAPLGILRPADHVAAARAHAVLCARGQMAGAPASARCREPAHRNAGMSGPVVVIGAGQAAAQLAMSLRQGKFAERIVILGDEPYLPYQRPPLSKKFLSERRGPDVLFLRPEKFWRDQNVDFELGARVAAIDPARRRVT